jgi:hypothetical protein
MYRKQHQIYDTRYKYIFIICLFGVNDIVRACLDTFALILARFVVREKHCSFAEKVRLKRQANMAIEKCC